MKSYIAIAATLVFLSGCAIKTARDDPHAVVSSGILVNVEMFQPNAHNNSSPIVGKSNVAIAANAASISVEFKSTQPTTPFIKEF